MYNPPNCPTLDKVSEPQVRVGIQGSPKTGKTFGALTFPNPIVLNLDRGLGAHHGRADVIEVPLYDIDYCKTINPNHKDKYSLYTTLMEWFKKVASKLESDQTLVFDGGTGLQNLYHDWYSQNKVYSSSGKIDDFAQWRLKIEFFSSIMELFKTLKCHIVYITHESEKKDKDGGYTGKLRPLLTGQFQDQLASHFTDWVRQHSCDKLKEDKIDEKALSAWGMTKAEFIVMQDSFPRNTLYFWQLESDDTFDGGISSLINFPRFIPSNYTSFCKYRRKPNFSVPVVAGVESAK